MYVGNGETVSFPLPRGHDGSRCLYRHGGDVAVLRDGEGYSVSDGEAVFERPPAAGDEITFGSAAEAYVDAEAAVARIVQAVTVAEAVSAAAKAALAEIKAYGTKLREELIREMADERSLLDEKIDACEDELDAELSSHIGRAIDWHNRYKTEINRLCRDMTDDAESSARDAAMAVNDARAIRDEVAHASAELAGLVKAAGEVLDANAHQHVRQIEAAAMKKCAVMEAAFGKLDDQISARREHIERALGAATAKVSQIESRLADAVKQAEYVERLRRGGH